jgi:hypothetical protein
MPGVVFELAEYWRDRALGEDGRAKPRPDVPAAGEQVHGCLPLPHVAGIKPRGLSELRIAVRQLLDPRAKALLAFARVGDGQLERLVGVVGHRGRAFSDRARTALPHGRHVACSRSVLGPMSTGLHRATRRGPRVVSAAANRRRAQSARRDYRVFGCPRPSSEHHLLTLSHSGSSPDPLRDQRLMCARGG